MNNEVSEWHKNAADAVKAVLMDRGGFDGWWGGIDEETCDEIMDAVAAAIAEQAPK